MMLDDEDKGLEAEADADEIDISEPEGEVVDLEDGGAEVTLDNVTEADEAGEHFENLAERFPSRMLDNLAVDLIEKVERDREARKKRESSYAEQMAKLGLDGAPTGGADFEGASKVVHPMIIEGCIDFAANAIRELFPVDGPDGGPIKHHVAVKPTAERVEKARRKSRWMNHQLTRQMPGFRNELEQLLTQEAFIGDQYLKFAWDHNRKRPEAIYRPTDRILFPFDAGSFESAHRKTDWQTLTQAEFSQRVASGMYIDVAAPSSISPETTDVEDVTARIEGKEDPGLNQDGSREIYETYVYLELEEDQISGGAYAPYIVSIDRDAQKVVGMYRNWDPKDQNRECIDFIVSFPFIPWRGALSIGLTQLIGGLSTAATGALRALLDSAHANNMMSVLKLKGPESGKDISLKLGQVNEVGGSTQTDDIRKVALPYPFSPPSPVLFQLLGFLSDAGRGLVQVAVEKLAEGNPNMPVGTTLALIEQGTKVFSSIHARNHAALGRCFKILHTLNRFYLEDQEIEDELGELVARRSDFEGPMDVVPVSDPNIFCEAQRMAQMQMIAQRAQMMPAIYDPYKVEELVLTMTKVPNAKELLVKRPEPKRLNAVNENIALTSGTPIVAFPDQNHPAHLKTHIAFGRFILSSPAITQAMAPAVMPGMLVHIKDHIAFLYVTEVTNMIEASAGAEIKDLMDEDPDVQFHLDDLLDDASEMILQIDDETGQPVQGQLVKILTELKVDAFLTQAQQFMQSIQPPQPMDPAQAAAQKVQVEQTKVQQDGQLKTQELEQKAAAEAAKVNAKAQESQAKLQASQAEMMQETRLAEVHEQNQMAQHADNVQVDQTKIEVDWKKNVSDNQTAMTIAAAEIEAGNESNLSTGTGINPGA